ncbi:LysE family transporter [Myxococcota bacterium]|jgi:threonine/homoserine/homoserine lactone efflux protein|nr:LysE family transporter [Myxococcota bacterium]
MIEVLLKGLATGVLAGVPLGPASAAVVDASMHRSGRVGLAIGLGAAMVDLIECLVATMGFGALLSDRPDVVLVLRGIGAVVLVGMGVVMVRRPPVDLEHPRLKRPVATSTLVSAFGLGFAISLFNPALLTTWVMLAGTVFAGLSFGQAVAASTGVFLGTSAWFLGLVLAARRGRLHLGPHAVWVTRIAGGGLILYGLFLWGQILWQRLAGA